MQQFHIGGMFIGKNAHKRHSQHQVDHSPEKLQWWRRFLIAILYFSLHNRDVLDAIASGCIGSFC